MFTKALANELAARHPKLLTVETARRRGRRTACSSTTGRTRGGRRWRASTRCARRPPRRCPRRSRGPRWRRAWRSRTSASTTSGRGSRRPATCGSRSTRHTAGSTSGRSSVLDVNVSDFDFELPEALIAQEATERGRSRLLVPRRGTGDRARDVQRPGPLPACRRSAGAERHPRVSRTAPRTPRSERRRSGVSADGPPAPVDGDPPGARGWDALVHPGQKLKPGARMVFEGEGRVLHGEILARRFHGRRTVRLWTDDPGGVSPLSSIASATCRCPTSSATIDPAITSAIRPFMPPSAVRSPRPPRACTSPNTSSRRSRRGCRTGRVTLHVGYGTFKPVRVERVEEHEVDPERYAVTAEGPRRRSRARRRRAGASSRWARRHAGAGIAHDLGRWRGRGGLGDTRLFIHPGHQFRLVEGSITNFHLPRSSLLMLVAAFAGRERILDAYREAVVQRYRFYSYGDANAVTTTSPCCALGLMRDPATGTWSAVSP